MARPRIDQFPNSSQEHNQIRLDVMQPLAATFQAITGTPVAIDLTGYELFIFEAVGADMWLEFTDAVSSALPPTEGAFLAGVHRIADGEIITLTVFDVAQMWAAAVSGSGTLYINAISRWVSLNTDIEVTNR